MNRDMMNSLTGTTVENKTPGLKTLHLGDIRAAINKRNTRAFISSFIVVLPFLRLGNYSVKIRPETNAVPGRRSHVTPSILEVGMINWGICWIEFVIPIKIVHGCLFPFCNQLFFLLIV